MSRYSACRAFILPLVCCSLLLSVFLARKQLVSLYASPFPQDRSSQPSPHTIDHHNLSLAYTLPPASAKLRVLVADSHMQGHDGMGETCRQRYLLITTSRSPWSAAVYAVCDSWAAHILLSKRF